MPAVTRPGRNDDRKRFPGIKPRFIRAWLRTITHVDDHGHIGLEFETGDSEPAVRLTIEDALTLARTIQERAALHAKLNPVTPEPADARAA